MQPHGRQPTRLPIPGILQARTLEWVAIFLLQCMKVKSEREVAQSCLTVSDPMDCSLPSFSIHGIFQARVLEWDAIAFSERKVIQPQMSVVLGMRSPTLNWNPPNNIISLHQFKWFFVCLFFCRNQEATPINCLNDMLVLHQNVLSEINSSVKLVVR